MKSVYFIILTLLFTLVTNHSIFCQKTVVSPLETGNLIIDDLLSRPEFMIYRSDHFTGIHYAEACAGFGAIRLAGMMKDTLRLKKLQERYSNVPGMDSLINTSHVDANVYGILPLELYLQVKNEEMLRLGLVLADNQWKDTIEGGLTAQTRYWIDDMWMIGSLQVQAYRATGKMIYLDRAALEISSYLKKLQQPDGLFYHGENAPFFWGRGNGWVAAALAELLSELPQSNPNYSFILEGYKKMMAALIKYQADDGMWRQLINVKEAWKETSSTAMFGYAITTGINKGLLPGDYYPACIKAWESLVKYINGEGKITEVCAGTGKSNDINYYLNRPRITGDLHGQAPVLWFAYSLIQAENHK